MSTPAVSLRAPSIRRVVAVDLGQGACRVAVVVDGTERRLADSTGFSNGIEPSQIITEAVQRAIGNVTSKDPKGASATDIEWRVAVGTTGLNGQPPDAGSLAMRLSKLGVRGDCIFGDDSVTAYLGALGPRSGAVVAAGTGVVAIGVDADANGICARSDGWGSQLGDRGSGYWIGMQAIRRSLRSWDAGHPGPLLALVEQVWGRRETLADRWRTRQPDPHEIAALAPAVADLARDGDLASLDIWRTAGRLLAESVSDVIATAGMTGRAIPVTGVGGVFEAKDLVGDAFVARLAELHPAAEPITASGSSLDGAVLLATSPSIPSALRGLVARHDIGPVAYGAGIGQRS